MKLEGKYCIVTGGSSGIGYDLVKQLLDQGVHVLAVSRRAEKMAIEHECLIKKNFDLSTKTAIDEMFDYAMEAFGQIDLFIANAGFAYYEILDYSDWRHIEDIFRLNTLGVIYSATKMKERFKDSPFNFMVTASAVSFLSMPGHALYSSTKAAIRGFMDAMQLESQKHHVFQTVFPVAVKTPFFVRAKQEHLPWPVQSSEHVAKTMIKGIKKDKKRIYPFKLFKYSYLLLPWFFVIYVKIQTKKFFKIMRRRKEE